VNRIWSTVVAICLLVAHASTGLAADKAGPQTDAAKWGRLTTATAKSSVKATAIPPATKVVSSQKKSLLGSLWSKLTGKK
jgi:hypothetical protein